MGPGLTACLLQSSSCDAAHAQVGPQGTVTAGPGAPWGATEAKDGVCTSSILIRRAGAPLPFSQLTAVRGGSRAGSPWPCTPSRWRHPHAARERLPARAAARPAQGQTARKPPPAQWCLSCVHAQTRFSCKNLRNNLADRPACSRKRRFRPQQFAQRNCVSSGLLSLHHPKRLAAPRTAIAFPQSGHRLPALHKKLRRQHLTEGAELQNDHVAYAVGIDNLPTVSSPCSWPTTATHAVMRSILIDDWIMETLSRRGDWLRVALDS